MSIKDNIICKIEFDNNKYVGYNTRIDMLTQPQQQNQGHTSLNPQLTFDFYKQDQNYADQPVFSLTTNVSSIGNERLSTNDRPIIFANFGSSILKARIYELIKIDSFIYTLSGNITNYINGDTFYLRPVSGENYCQQYIPGSSNTKGELSTDGTGILKITMSIINPDKNCLPRIRLSSNDNSISVTKYCLICNGNPVCSTQESEYSIFQNNLPCSNQNQYKYICPDNKKVVCANKGTDWGSLCK